jgi:hypothetical protein
VKIIGDKLLIENKKHQATVKCMNAIKPGELTFKERVDIGLQTGLGRH